MINLVELAHNYETVISGFVRLLEARFVNMNPILQQMFLKLESMDKREEKDFVSKTLLMIFDDIVKEARIIFDHYDLFGIPPSIIYTLKMRDIKMSKYIGKTENKEETDIFIPFKVLAISDALHRNFGWISILAERPKKGHDVKQLRDLNKLHGRLRIDGLKNVKKQGTDQKAETLVGL